MPKVSVIIPAHNSAPFVGRAIRSVLQQTFEDLELIVVDDGSTDGTGSVVKSFLDERISYIYQANRGPNAARNRGIEQARGELLAFLDSDDWWLPRKLEAQLRLFSSLPEAGLIYTATLKVDSNGRLLKFRPVTREGMILSHLIMNNDIGGPSSVIVPRKTLDVVGPFDEQLWRAEDWEMWLRIAASFRVAAVREPLVCITYRDDSHGGNIAALRDDSLTVLNRAFASYAAHLGHLRPQAFARVHLHAGIRFATNGQIRDSRRELMKAIQMKPLLLEAYWRWALTLLGTGINHWARRAKETVRLKILERWAAGKGMGEEYRRIDP